MIVLLTTLFFLTLSLFGWEASRRVLQENRIERLLALSPVVGIGLYTFFLNILGQFISIQVAFYAVYFTASLGALISFCAHWYHTDGLRKLHWGIDIKWRKILLAAAIFVAGSMGSISLHHPMDLATFREPTAATIAEGNFPPKEIWSPENTFQYHYAPDLFFAATHTVAGTPLYITHDIVVGLLSSSVFLLVFILVNLFFNNSLVAFWAAGLSIYSGSLVVLKGLQGIPAILNTYVFNTDTPTSFKFVTDAMGMDFDFGHPAVNYMVHVYWGALAFALLLAIIYLYLYALRSEHIHTRWYTVFLITILYAFFALVAESLFAILTGTLLVFPIALWVLRQEKEIVKKALHTSLVIVCIGLPIAIFQGGVLESAITQQVRLPATSLENDGVMLFAHDKGDQAPLSLKLPLSYNGISIFDIDFFEKWIPLLVLLPFAMYFVFKRQQDFAIFFLIIISAFFLSPLFLHSDFTLIKGNIGRFFYPVHLLGGMFVGIFFASMYLLSKNIFIKYTIIAGTLLIMAQGLWTQGVWLVFGYPPGQEIVPNSAYFAKEGSIEGQAYTWVKEHTTIKDTFLIIQEEYSDCGYSGAPNCLFIFNTGRMAPIFRYHQTWPIEDTKASKKIELFDDLRKTCKKENVVALGYTYYYVDIRSAKGMETICKKNNSLRIVYEDGDGDQFVRIYAIENNP